MFTSTTPAAVESALRIVDTPSVETLVRQYFEDIPVMAEIAECESHFRQYDENGNVLRGVENRRDVGVMQINEKYHLEDALKLGLDIYSINGNLAYAQHLHEKFGTAPWKHSKKCWGSSPIARAE